MIMIGPGPLSASAAIDRDADSRAKDVTRSSAHDAAEGDRGRPRVFAGGGPYGGQNNLAAFERRKEDPPQTRAATSALRDEIATRSLVNPRPEIGLNHEAIHCRLGADLCPVLGANPVELDVANLLYVL